jgi:hypothetical protein
MPSGRLPLHLGDWLPEARPSIHGCIPSGRFLSAPNWFATMAAAWHRRKAARLAARVEKRRKMLDQLIERAARHEHRAKHWGFIANRRGQIARGLTIYSIASIKLRYVMPREDVQPS